MNMTNITDDYDKITSCNYSDYDNITLSSCTDNENMRSVIFMFNEFDGIHIN